MSFDDEQQEILTLVEEHCGNLGKGWNKYKGDVVCRIVKQFIDRHISSSSKTVCSSVFVSGLPFEFDMLIVDQNAKPIELTNAFEPEKVHVALEVKKSGVFSIKNAQRIKQNFDLVTNEFQHIKCGYLTIGEVIPVKQSSIHYYRESKKILAPHGFFALSNLRNKEPILAEWEQFVAFSA